MNVILRKNFNQLGKIGDLVDVKDGFARNFLIPRQIASPATKGNIKALEVEKLQMSKKLENEHKECVALSEELAKVSVTIPVTVGEEDKIFGTVTSQMVSDAIKEKGFDIDKRKIELPEQIKTLGIFDVTIKLHPEVSTVVKTWVVRE